MKNLELNRKSSNDSLSSFDTDALIGLLKLPCIKRAIDRRVVDYRVHCRGYWIIIYVSGETAEFTAPL